MTLREEFEAWHMQTFGFVDKATVLLNGVDYMPSITRTRWVAWQAARSGVDPTTPLSMDSAPRDGTIIRVLVEFDTNSLEDSSDPVWTIGANCRDNTGDDIWQLAGWNWSHDCFCEGAGKPLGWLPMHAPTVNATSDPLGDLRVAADKAIRAMQTCVVAMNSTRFKVASFDEVAIREAIKALEGQGAGQ